MKKFYAKSNEKVIAIRGEDKEKFLQNIITNDVKILQDNNSIYSLILNNKGRYLVDFFLVNYKNLTLLVTCTEGFQHLFNLLNEYKLQNKIDIFDASKDCAVFYLSGQIGINELDQIELNGASIEYADGKIFKDPRHKLLPIRIILDSKQGESHLQKYGFELNSSYNYNNIRLKLGIPQGGVDLVYEKSLPHEFMLDKLNAISYNKGCYIGQELVARSKYVGVIRKHVMKIVSFSPIKTENKEVFAVSKDGTRKVIGKLSSYENNLGIAIVKIEEYEYSVSNNEHFILEDGNVVQIMRPSYITN